MPPSRQAPQGSAPQGFTPQRPPRSRATAPGKRRPGDAVDPAWLLKAGASIVAVCLLLAYLTLCGLFYFEQWQLVLHPSRTVAQTPANEGLAFQAIRFGPDLSGQPQLAGWWIPSDLPTDPTVLMLHGEDGSRSEALPAALALHRARLNVLLFDYRGFGDSGGKHPTEQLMRHDAETALYYLTQDRQVAPAQIVVYGSHLGSSLAVSLCAAHPQIPAIILQSADGDTESRILRDTRTRIVPISILFHQRFPLADALHRLATPKLMLSYTEGPAPEIAQRAADPKTTVELPRNTDPAEITRVIRRFLNTYVPYPPSLL